MKKKRERLPSHLGAWDSPHGHYRPPPLLTAQTILFIPQTVGSRALW